MKTNEIIAGLRKLCGQGTEYRRTICRQAADTLEAQQKRIEELEAERRWIPVTERLPEVGVLVLACTESEVDMTYRESEDFWGTDPDCRITHWMPLPEPVKEEV